MNDNELLINYNIYELADKHKLSRRVINGCLNSGLVTLYAILNYYFKHGNFTYLRRCGAKCNSELINLCSYYISKYQINQDKLKINSADQIFDEFKIFIHTNFGLNSNATEQYRECYKQKKFILFSFILFTLEKTLNEKEFYVFLHNYGFIKNLERVPYQNIGDTFNLTRERARQIYKALPRQITKIVTKLKQSNLPIDSYMHQYDDVKNLPDYYNIDTEFADKINNKEKINITPKFCCFIISLLSDKNYRMIQNIENNYNNYFSINKTYYDKVKLNKLFTYLETKSNTRRPEDVEINIDELITKFLNYENTDIVHNEVLHKFIIEVSKTCFNFSTSQDYMFLIAPRNTMTKISEHIISILKAKNAPMSLTEIYNEVHAKTDKKPTYESLRSSILNTKEVVAIGKTSTYALKSWKEVNTKKIKDIVYDLLIQNPTKHFTITEVTDYVRQFRDTNAKNIRTNLKLDTTGRFAFDNRKRLMLSNDTNQE